MRSKRFVYTAPTVALNVIQMTYVGKTHETARKYSGFREVSVLAFKQTSRSATCTCLQPLRYSQVLGGICWRTFVDTSVSTIFGCVFYDANSTCEVHWYILQGLHNIPRKWGTDTISDIFPQVSSVPSSPQFSALYMPCTSKYWANWTEFNRLSTFLWLGSCILCNLACLLSSKKCRHSSSNQDLCCFSSSGPRLSLAVVLIFGPTKDDLAGELRKQHNEELNEPYSSPNIVRVIKSRRVRCNRHVSRMWEMRDAYRVLMGKSEGKRHLARATLRVEDNIKMDLQEVPWRGHGLHFYGSG